MSNLELSEESTSTTATHETHETHVTQETHETQETHQSDEPLECKESKEDSFDYIVDVGQKVNHTQEKKTLEKHLRNFSKFFTFIFGVEIGILLLYTVFLGIETIGNPLFLITSLSSICFLIPLLSTRMIDSGCCCERNTSKLRIKINNCILLSTFILFKFLLYLGIFGFLSPMDDYTISGVIGEMIPCFVILISLFVKTILIFCLS